MRRGSHKQYDIKYHVVWITKYRYKILHVKIAYRLIELIRQVCEARNIKIIKGSISKEHVHMLVSCPPNISVSQMMQYLKGRSSKKLQEEFPELKRKYWGQHIWATGYFCRTVGTVTNEMIKEYIENQTDDTEEVFKIIK